MLIYYQEDYHEGHDLLTKCFLFPSITLHFLFICLQGNKLFQLSILPNPCLPNSFEFGEIDTNHK